MCLCFHGLYHHNLNRDDSAPKSVLFTIFLFCILLQNNLFTIMDCLHTFVYVNSDTYNSSFKKGDELFYE
jgi:hypothetical protein